MAQSFTSFFGGVSNLEPKVLQSEKDILSAAFGQTSVDIWESGGQVTTPEDLRNYNHRVYQAPFATPAAPVLMNPTGPDNSWRQVQDFVYDDAEVMQQFSLPVGALVSVKGIRATGEPLGFFGGVLPDSANLPLPGGGKRGYNLPNGNWVVPIYDSIIQVSGLNQDDVQLWLEGEVLLNGSQIRVYNGYPYAPVEGATFPLVCSATPNGDPLFERWILGSVAGSSRTYNGLANAGDTTITIGGLDFETCFLSINGVVQTAGRAYTIDNTGSVSVIDLLGVPLDQDDEWSVIINNVLGAVEAMIPAVGAPQTADGLTASFSLPTATQLDVRAYLAHIDGVHQVPGVDFTIGNDKLTFNEIPPNGAKIDITAYQPVLNPTLGDVSTGSVTANGVSKSLNEWMTSAAAITATATGSTTSRSLGDRFSDVVNVKDFGAVGDGSTNDTLAFQAAVDYAIANKRTLHVEGRYRLENTINLTGNINMTGGLSNQCFIEYTQSPCFEITPLPPYVSNLKLEGMTLVARGAAGAGGTAIKVAGGIAPNLHQFPTNVTFDDIYVQSVRTGLELNNIRNLTLRNCKSIHCSYPVLLRGQCVVALIDNCDYQAGVTVSTDYTQGIRVLDSSNYFDGVSRRPENIMIKNSRVVDFKNGIELRSVLFCCVRDNDLDAIKNKGIILNTVQETTIDGNWIAMMGSTSIGIDTTAGSGPAYNNVVIRGNAIRAVSSNFQWGIHLGKGRSNFIIDSNKIQGCSYPIWAETSNQHHTFISNFFANVVYLGDGSNNCSFIGNYLSGSGVRITNSDNISFTGNTGDAFTGGNKNVIMEAGKTTTTYTLPTLPDGALLSVYATDVGGISRGDINVRWDGASSIIVDVETPFGTDTNIRLFIEVYG